MGNVPAFRCCDTSRSNNRKQQESIVHEGMKTDLYIKIFLSQTKMSTVMDGGAIAWSEK